ncbi:hypothetical protein IIB79_09060, partial [candidate division KSB1 bacterium]|nr:hypothetical protein [candidate division KSB1 bacterium]
MAFDNFIKNLHNSKSFSNCYEKAKSCEHFTVTGLSESSASLFIAGLTSNHSDQIIVITSDPKSSEHLRSDLEVIGESEVHLFPSYRGLHLQEKQINTDIKLARLKSLQELSTGSPGIYIIEVRALLNDIVSPEVFKNRSITLKTGEDNDFELLVEYLVEEGFQRESMVEDFGDMSVRGGIIDIFPPNYYEPVRVEFFGNTIESIRIFDINDQRSIRTIDSAVIVPPTIDISEDTMPDFTSADSSILTYFSNSATLFFHHPFQAQRTLKEYYDGLKHDKELQNTAELPDDAVVFKNIENYFESRSAAYIRSDITAGNGKHVVHFDFKTLPQFNRSLNLFSKVFNDYHADYPDLTVAVLCDNEGQSDRLKEIILDDDLLSSAYFVRTGSLSSGFVYPEARLALVNDHEIFSRKHTVKPKKLYGARKVLFDDLALRIGDYVVHEDHGIGKYLGLKKISIGQSEQEALKISYRDNDILYLNLEKLPNLEKYTGREGYKPELSKLGGVDWEKIKRKTWIPKAFSAEEFWSLVKMVRKAGVRTPILDTSGEYFVWNKSQHYDRLLHELDLHTGGRLIDLKLFSEEEKKGYVSRGLIEEAIASAQLEGAHTTRDFAKKMILFCPIGNRYIRNNKLDALILETLEKIDANIFVRMPPTDEVNIDEGKKYKANVVFDHTGIRPWQSAQDAHS